MCSKIVNLLILISLAYSAMAVRLFKRPTSIPASLKLFSAKVMNEMTKTENDINTLFSPLPLQAFLTLISVAAVPDLRMEIWNALQIPYLQSESNMLNYFKQVFEGLPNYTSTKFDITLNSLISGYQIHPRFKKIALENFQTTNEVVTKFDIDQLNRVVARHSNQYFKRFLVDRDFPRVTFGALTNCLLINGNFAQQFRTKFTSEEAFYDYGHIKSLTSMMHMNGTMEYANLKDLDAQAIILPFENEHVRLLILLPNKFDHLKQTETAFTTMRGFTNFVLPLQRREVELTLPKIDVNYNFKVKDVLTELGMETAFTDTANFSALFEEALSSKFGNVRQLSYFNLHEAGISIASAMFVNFVKTTRRARRGVSVAKSTQPPINKIQITNKKQAAHPDEEPGAKIKFTVDHPFSFMLYSEQNVFLLGHYSNVPIF